MTEQVTITPEIEAMLDEIVRVLKLDTRVTAIREACSRLLANEGETDFLRKIGVPVAKRAPSWTRECGESRVFELGPDGKIYPVDGHDS